MMRSRRRDGCYTCGSALKYSFPVVVARARVHVQAYKVGIEREVLLTNGFSLSEGRELRIITPPRDLLKHLQRPHPAPLSADSAESEEVAQGPPCFSSPALLFFHPRGARNGAEISAGCVN